MSSAALSAGPIRLVLAGIPGLTAGVVRQYVGGQSDISIVSELRDAADVTALALARPIDVVVTARTAQGVPAACQQLLFGQNAVPVIVINPDGRLEIYDRRVLREAALGELLGEIRRAAARGAALTSEAHS
jgi:hypothetical protein